MFSDGGGLCKVEGWNKMHESIDLEYV